MSIPKRAALLLALAAAHGPAWTMDENNEFRSVGIGAQPCSAYLDSRRADDPNAWAPYGVWMTGFITANNLMRRETYDLLGDYTPERALDVLDGYCGENPQHPFVFAVMQLVSQELAPQRVQRKPTTAPATVPVPAPGD